MNDESRFFFTRHTLRPDPPTKHDAALPESERYKGITDDGVEMSKQRTKDIIDIIDCLPNDSIMFIGGASELERTKSTAEVYGDSLSEHYKDQKDIVIITRSEIDKIIDESKKEDSKILVNIQKIIDDNFNKKLVFTYPLFIKEFSLIPEFIDPKTKRHTDYTKALYKAGEGFEYKGAEILMKSAGKIVDDNKEVTGITPQEIAVKYLRGIKRLYKFTKKFSGDRQVTIGIVSHAWILDAFVSYLSNNGIAGHEGWNKAGGKMIDKNEMGKILIRGNNLYFSFRGKEYPISQDLLSY